MNYTPLILFALGALGVLLHNLVELNKLNKSSNCTFSIKQYFRLEIFSIISSLIVVYVCVLVSSEIKQLQAIGNWLGVAFVSFGYMGQSLLIFVMGRVNKIVNNEKNNTDNSGNNTSAS